MQASMKPEEQVLFQCTDAGQTVVLFKTHLLLQLTIFFGKQKTSKPQVSGMRFLDMRSMEAFKTGLQYI